MLTIQNGFSTITYFSGRHTVITKFNRFNQQKWGKKLSGSRLYQRSGKETTNKKC
jgi:hypothetical protein